MRRVRADKIVVRFVCGEHTEILLGGGNIVVQCWSISWTANSDETTSVLSCPTAVHNNNKALSWLFMIG